MEQKNNFLAEAPVGKLLVKFAVPCVLSLLLSALYNIVDQIFIGQSVGYLGNAATNVVYPFTVVALAVVLLIGDGAAALFSLSPGRGDTKTGNRCGWIALILSVSAGVLLTVALVFVELRRMRRKEGVTVDAEK